MKRSHRFPVHTGFTLVELLTVVAIIAILAGLVLSTAGYAQKKGARARAESEIAAMEAALESYKVDNGIYPRDASTTDTLNPVASVNPKDYAAASLHLYKQLSGDLNADGKITTADADPVPKAYFEFKPQMLSATKSIIDPWGNNYGYSTIQAKWSENPTGTAPGYNPTFDLWSTSGQTTANGTVSWVKNW